MNAALRSPCRAAAILLLTLLAATCATSAPGSAPRGQSPAISPDERRQLDDLRAEIRAQERALAAAHAEAAPDCRRACPLAGNVCALAQRICAIAARYPDEAEVAAACDDARARCQRARQSAGARCPCRQDP